MVDLSFDLMFIDEVVATIEIKNNKLIKAETFTNEPYKQPFLVKPIRLDYVISVLSKKVIQPDYHNISGVLEDMGLDEYDAIEILKITHGVCHDNFLWVRFKGEQLTWEDVKPSTRR